MVSQKADEMESKRIDAFILYNEREKTIDKIAEVLESNNISTHFWKRDVQFGDPILELEEKRFLEAEIILVFLGDFGWGQTHLSYAEKALELKKRIIPVLIGNPEESELDKANALFRERRRIDLRELNEQGFKQLLDVFQNRRPVSDGFDNIINDLINGDEKKRSDVMRQILTTNIDRAALAARLRSEIQKNYSPDNEKNYALAQRPPDEMPGIRSWMLSALIRSDVENTESRRLLLRHVSQSYEPSSFVRYWTLAGLYHRRASFLNEALDIGLKDSKAEVKALARAIKSPDDAKLIEEFRRDLRASKYERVWKVLRVLRMFSIPALANDVCAVLLKSGLGLPTSYDALYALSNPAMAAEAVKIIHDHNEIEKVLAHVISAIHNSTTAGNFKNEYTIENFTTLLAAFEPSEIGRALSEAENDPQNREIVSRLRFYLKNYPESETINEIYAASYDSDTSDEKALKRDPLGIQKDVQTLCAVMLSNTVKPPLAIGLFGDWGTGKSFFIQSMQLAVRDLAKNPGKRFCSNVVQIEFNAWHYSDTNLWASLVSYILARLAAYVAPQETDEEKHAALLSQLDSARAILNEAQIQKTNAEKTINDHEDALKTLQSKLQETEVKLSDLRTSDLADVLLEDKDLKKKLKESFEEIGIPKAVEKVSDLKEAVSEAQSIRVQAGALFRELRGRKSWVFWLVFSVILIVPPLFFLAAPYLPLDEIKVRISSAILWIGGFTSFVYSVIRVAKPIFEKIKATKDKAQKVIDAKQLEEETKLQKEIDALKLKEQETAARITTATARVVELEERIRDIENGRNLNRFLMERTSSEDYRKHLGIISTIRQDFDTLRERLDHASINRDVGFNPVDRIILYIDDLDRCASDKVMDVLQAVHLLLAYPLFVVVVGVDPRWLLHSLETTHSAFQHSQTKTQPNANVWRTTPQNYLEKIFQIPFNLKPMTPPGYGKLIDGLFTVPAVEQSEEMSHIKQPESKSPPPETSVTPVEGTAGDSESGNNPDPTEQETENNQSDTDTETPENDASSTVTDGATIETKADGATVEDKDKPAFVVYEEALIIKEWESDFAKKLFTLIPTPRAAKRFSNIYRLLKAGVPRRDIPRFEGAKNAPGEFRIPMLLLAMLIGGAAECTVLFPELQQIVARDGELTEALEILEKLPSNEPADKTFVENSRAFVRKVRRIVETQSIPHLPKVYAEWIPRVARFSFDVGRVVKATSDESSEESFR